MIYFRRLNLIISTLFIVIVNVIEIETYSSKIGNWTVCVHRKSSYQSFKSFENGIYWNGAIHWLGYVFGSSLHFKLDFLLDNPVLTTIKLPVTVDGNLYCNRKLFESYGCLFLACMRYAYSGQLHILEMRNGYSGWSVKYIVNHDDLMMPYPLTWGINSSVWFIVLGEREEVSFMVIESCGKLLQYKIVLKTVHTFFDFGSTRPRKSFLFIASFAGVLNLKEEAVEESDLASMGFCRSVVCDCVHDVQRTFIKSGETWLTWFICGLSYSD
ncbi:hypothetical protein Tco_0385213 [Tanacetum coccineum]